MISPLDRPPHRDPPHQRGLAQCPGRANHEAQWCLARCGPYADYRCACQLSMLSLAYVPFVSRNILLSFRIQKGVRAAVHARAESSLSSARLRVSAKLTLAAPVPQHGAPDPPGVPCADRRACASRQIFRDRSGRSCGEAITPQGFLQGSWGQTACVVCCSAKRGGPGSLGCSATMRGGCVAARGGCVGAR